MNNKLNFGHIKKRKLIPDIFLKRFSRFLSEFRKLLRLFHNLIKKRIILNSKLFKLFIIKQNSISLFLCIFKKRKHFFLSIAVFQTKLIEQIKPFFNLLSFILIKIK